MRGLAITIPLTAGLIFVVASGSAAPVKPDASATSPAADRLEPITPIPAPPEADDRSRLGASLFDDPRLSYGGVRSCSSCHDLGSNGADAARVDLAPDGRPLRRNTPTVFDAALEFRQDWDGALRTLEEQAAASIEDPGMMGGRWAEILPELRGDPEVSTRFERIYGRAPDRAGIIDALAAFERTLLTPDSRFDRWLRGDAAALSAQELEGYRLFKYVGCASCHQGVSVGGNLFERNDVFRPLFKDRAERVRVASLRNVAVTAPYFDDGSAATLDDAVDRMAEAQLGSKLTPEQRTSIVAFLGTLTGTYQGRSLATPPVEGR